MIFRGFGSGKQSAICHPRVLAHVDLGQLARNLEVVVRLAARHRAKEPLGAVPMVKSNGYGHGLAAVALTLERRPATVALGVATLDEAVALREAGVAKPIWVFSDCAPWSETIASAVERYRLTPVIHTFEDLRRMLKTRGSRPTPEFQLKFNTGMNRLGIDSSEAGRASRLIAAEKGRARLRGVCTHLAMGEEPRSRLTRVQSERFLDVIGVFSKHDIAYIHSSNTAASLAGGLPQTGAFAEMTRACNILRPGIGVFGYSDVTCAALKPALSLRARVLSCRRLSPRDSVGYGATFSARRACPESVVSIGYGDGLFRALSNGSLILNRRPVGVLGRVSMDLACLGLVAKPGAWVTLLGESQAQGEHMARQAGTVVYEILTAISQRVPRIYRS